MQLTVRPTCGLRPTPVLRLHRAYATPLDDDHRRLRRGLPVVGLERAMVASWPLLAPDQARAAVLRAVRDRRTTPDRRRDVALAAAGWVVLRFGYGRVVGDPAGVRREVTSVLTVRRAQLRTGR